MIKNYFKTAWRNLIKNKASSSINIGGLAVGMAVAMLIGLWIWDELSFNKYHQNYDRIAQVMQKKTFNGTLNTMEATSLPVEEELRKNYSSDVKHTGVMFWTQYHVLTIGDKKLSFLGTYVTPEIPEMFTLKMLKGSRNTLQDPSSLLVSQSVAKALFGNAEPIGKIVKFDNQASMIVWGVYQDLPVNTTIHDIAFMASWSYFTSTQGWLKRAVTEWGEDSFQVFVQVADGVNMDALSKKIKDIKLKNGDAAEVKLKPQLFLQPMSKWHLYAQFKNGVNTGGAIEYVWLFGIIGVFVLLLACINFMNLSTARSEKRAKEVGIRKAVGSVRGQLIGQFFCESLLIAVIAFGFSLLLVMLALPLFNELANKQLNILWDSPFFWLMSIGFTLFTGIIAGSYPALYLSSFQPVKVLKGTFKAGPLAAIPRKVLVVMQFTVSIVLIVGTIVVFNQIQFAKIIIKINPNVSTHQVIRKIEAICKAFAPAVPFSYQFVDDEYAKKFGDEERIGKLASCFAGLAIFISCLGLFGMASFMAEQRIKEIGVRKVLGATVFNLWQLLSKDFVVLVIISLLIATPVSWYFMHKWLLGYQYRTEISWWIFAIAAIGAMIITLLTISYQSINAALANPVKSLKAE